MILSAISVPESGRLPDPAQAQRSPARAKHAEILTLTASPRGACRMRAVLTSPGANGYRNRAGRFRRRSAVPDRTPASRRPTHDEVLMRLMRLIVLVVITVNFLAAPCALTPCALAPIAVAAQPTDKVYRIGVLERTSPTVNAANLDSFRQGLRALGYVEGKNIVIEYRSADGRDERFAELAAELVRLKVDVILTRGTPAALAAKNATPTIPVVITGVGDPVGQGIIVSLARPGGNITGLSAIVTDAYPKRVELLKELAPKATRIAALFNMSNPLTPRHSPPLDPTPPAP